MGSNNELAQMAHLMRRAGFGASRGELDAYVAKGYENVVDDLVNPERLPDIDEDILERYFGGEGYPIFAGIWLFRIAELAEAAAREDGTVLAPCVRHRSYEESARYVGREPDKDVPQRGYDRHADDTAGACQRTRR